MLFTLWLGLFVPLLGFLVLMASSRILNRTITGIIGCTTIFVSFACFISLFLAFTGNSLDPFTAKLYSWIPVRGINADFSLHIDSLSLLMTLIITGVGFLIHVYSNGYMDHDEDIVRYFAFMNLFVFFMLLLVLASNLVLLFVGWEGVGLASYLLIGYWYEKPVAAQAAVKAFVMNRIGDLGFLLGLLLTFYLFGTSDIVEISNLAGSKFASGDSILTVLTLLLFVGAVGKSAQLPLYTWLPDAMAGPTPVSALIHAATMVTAGVYLVVRLHALYILAPITLLVISIIGAATALYAAICAVGQTDLKRVLAYSTVSQLGFMFLACGCADFYAAMFHLTMHAFMKALLFLSAGNVVHMMHDTTEMSKMGGLSKVFVKTNWMFLIGVLAMSGVPPFAAFFSKDLILEQEHLAGYNTLFYIGLIAAIFTAFYLTRAYCLTFTGQFRMSSEELKTVKEAPSVMLIPVAVLTVLSIIGGFLGYSFGKIPLLEEFLAKSEVTLAVPQPAEGMFSSPDVWMSILGGLFGIALAVYMYTGLKGAFPSPLEFLRRTFYVDEIYSAVIVQPLEALSRFVANVFEPKVFDGGIQISVQATQGIAGVLQRVQSGQIRSYIAWIVLGSVFLIMYLLP